MGRYMKPAEPPLESSAAGNQFKHGRSGYTNHRCRCVECRADWSAYCKDARERRRAKVLAGDVVIQHGSESSYFNYMCRCSECVEAHRLGDLPRRKARIERMEAGLAEVEHGKPSTYTNYACRCDACSVAASQYQASFRRRR